MYLNKVCIYIISIVRLGFLLEKGVRMLGQNRLNAIDDNNMAIALLQILRRKEFINQPTFEKTYKQYKERLKEVA